MDWDIVEDKGVRNELGVLVSQDNNWVITDPQIVMALRYGNPDYPPYSIGNEYVAVSEPNEAADSWVNRRRGSLVQERVRWVPGISEAVAVSARFRQCG